MRPHLLICTIATGVIGLSAAGCEPSGLGEQALTAPLTEITATDVADIPAPVLAAVEAARPGFVVSEAELKEREGRRYYDVEGTFEGADLELDLLETPQGWQVVEIQRDIGWDATPEQVRSAVEAARAGFTPVRIIESTQAADGAVIYELFAEGQSAIPALEVRVVDGQAEVLSEVWPH